MAALVFIALICWLIVCLPIFARGWASWILLGLVAVSATIAVHVGSAVYSASDLPEPVVFHGRMWRMLAPFTIVPFMCRMVSLVLENLGQNRSQTLWLDVIAIASMPAIIFAPALHRDWNYRAIPESCSANSIQFSMSEEKGELRRSGTRYALYFGRSIDDAVYVGNNKSERPLCRRSQNGKKRIDVSAITIRFEYSRHIRCEPEDSLLDWEKRYCGIGFRERPLYFPDDIIFFDPKEVRLGAFGIPRQNTIESFRAAKSDLDAPLQLSDPRYGIVEQYGDQYVVASEILMSDGSPLVAKCRSVQNATRLFCEFRHTLSPGLDIAWGATFSPETLSSAIVEINKSVFEVCASIFETPSLCDVKEP